MDSATETIWWTGRAGDLSGGLGARVVDEDAGLVLFGNQTPDRVRLPRDLGGTVARVLSVERVACPCGGGHGSRMFGLQARTTLGQDIAVVECVATRTFLWVGWSGEPSAREVS